jgi:calcineurin-like phosphoesterase family protein
MKYKTVDRKNIFFTSDLHIGHQNSLKFDNRPFRDLNHMHEVLVNNYNSTVKDGICYFLGDVGLSSAETVKNVISKMTGTKVLILGNHDKGVESMYKAGFDVVLHGATMQIAGQRVTLSHCPLLGVYREKTEGMTGSQQDENWHGESRLKQRIFTTTDEGQFHIHGHIHSPNGGKSQKILGRQFDVGVVANGYRPVSISVIESWIAKTKQDRT